LENIPGDPARHGGAAASAHSEKRLAQPYDFTDSKRGERMEFLIMFGAGLVLAAVGFGLLFREQRETARLIRARAAMLARLYGF
jgi:hypothetical protein